MNKLEQYKQDELKKIEGIQFENRDSYLSYYEKGFNVTIALELPVKFYEWAGGQTNEQGNLDSEFSNMSAQELYQYWINNIYKPA